MQHDSQNNVQVNMQLYDPSVTLYPPFPYDSVWDLAQNIMAIVRNNLSVLIALSTRHI